MKKVLFFLLIFSEVIIGQNQDENYVKTIIHKQAGNPSFINMMPNNTVKVDIVYYDGLGRPKQQISHAQSGTQGDLITHIEYDDLGRQTKQYLPYERSGASLDFDNNAAYNTQAFYNTTYFQNTTNPYTETDFENSLLNRVLRQAAPGNTWQMDGGKEIKMLYEVNAQGEIYHFIASAGGLTLSTANQGKYLSEQLYKTTTYDENDHYTIEYKNALGQVIAKAVQTSGEEGYEWNVGYTYYVYDIYGNLAYVLPPKLSDEIVSGNSLVSNYQQLLNEMGYQYLYDHRNRLVRKKLPGKHWEYLVYDDLNRIVASGPVHSPFLENNAHGWLHTKYDNYNRVAYTVWKESSNEPEAFAEEWGGLVNTYAEMDEISERMVDSQNTYDDVPIYYTNTVYPTTGSLLTIHYYDDYRFYDVDYPGDIFGQDVYYDHSNIPLTLATGGWNRVLETESNKDGNTYYTLYDNKARAIRQHSLNYLGGFTKTDMQYDFIGKVLQTYTEHQRDSQTISVEIEETFSYTDEDRLEQHVHTINGNNPEEIVNNQYDALGQLVTKEVGGQSSNPLQIIDYNYNIRGWLTDINNIHNLNQPGGGPVDLFAFKINYDQVTDNINGQVQPLYNGNIAEVFWRTATDNLQRKYGYRYDAQNRLTAAYYQMPHITVPRIDSYSTEYSYDLNGNLQTLNRKGEVEDPNHTLVIDDLIYDYDLGNKLINVTDLVGHSAGFNDGNDHTRSYQDDFEYDSYGNLTMDRNKGIDQIEYNHLNLPKKIRFQTREITYLYDATGVKTQKIVLNEEENTQTTTHYNDGFQYTDNQLDFFPHAEGYVKVLDYSVFKYVYTYTDHLGNIRLKYTQDPGTGQTEILEENHYYPFGLTHKGYNHKHLIFWESPGTGIQLVPVTPDLTDTYKYKFGGKEWQNELDLNYYDFGARNYDAALVRTFTPDPMAEVYYELSPYSFLNNNPISNIDPTGAVTLTGQAAKDWFQNLKDEIASKPRKRKEKWEDPIYDRRGNQIGDDGKTDGNAYLVRGKVMRDVKRATKAGEFYTGSLDESRNVFHVPTDNLLEDVITSVNNTIASGDSADTRVEHGAHSLIGDVNARHWDPGTPKTTETKEDGTVVDRWSITPFRINGRNQPGSGSYKDIRFIWHSHPSGSNPSPGDRSLMRKWTKRGFTGNAFLIDVNNMKVTFYNQRGSLLKIDYNVFLKIGRRQ